MVVFELLKFSKLISRKIWVVDKSWIFTLCKYAYQFYVQILIWTQVLKLAFFFQLQILEYIQYVQAKLVILKCTRRFSDQFCNILPKNPWYMDDLHRVLDKTKKTHTSFLSVYSKLDLMPYFWFNLLNCVKLPSYY